MRGGIWEIVLIVVLILILFGSAKIPTMMKNIATGIKTFKKEVKEEPTKPTPKKKAPVNKKMVAKKKSK